MPFLAGQQGTGWTTTTSAYGGSGGSASWLTAGYTPTQNGSVTTAYVDIAGWGTATQAKVLVYNATTRALIAQSSNILSSGGTGLRSATISLTVSTSQPIFLAVLPNTGYLTLRNDTAGTTWRVTVDPMTFATPDDPLPTGTGANNREFIIWLDGTTGDTTPPTVSSASLSSNGTTLTINTSEATTVGAGGNSGFTLTASGGATTLTYSSGSGTSSLVYTSSRTIYQGETLTLSYTQPGNGIEDSAGNDLATFSGTSVTNNSTQVAPVTHPSGWSTVTVGATIAASGDRVKGDPDIATGNIIGWGNIQGTGTVTVFSDGSYEFSAGVTSFQFQIYDGTWGNVGTITIGATGGASTISGRARRYISNTIQAIRTFARKI